MRVKAIVTAVLCGILLTACSKLPELPTLPGGLEISSENPGDASTEATTGKSNDEPAVSSKEFSFNPHVCSKKLYEAYGPEEWETFFKLVDALRKGEDTFECPSREIYEWCFSGGPLDELFPVGRYNLEMDFENGYTEGVGHITYLIPKDEFMKKQKAFEKMVMKIVNDNVDKDYTDFEKCIALYEYMINNYVYDYDEAKANESGDFYTTWDCGTYRTFLDKKGVCNELSNVYNYLLLQCGVEAAKYEGWVNTEPVGHAWSYVTLDGVGYFIDPTWGLPDQTDSDLQYFMITSDERDPDFDVMEPEIYYYDFQKKDVDFTAKDNRFAALHSGEFISFDKKKKILYYKVMGEKKKFYYG
ncbi:hypothetical protein D6856_14450 [Butyrivibrio sp. XB500-5]|uniref:transglutaminase domain-containing protein n=1 Tax=Butyrivibrio sp. XB500-5 TaxID=2364880 RepID=UPI000EAA734E|nr:transglutaminase domain-containing protein [Butyrivibrio sp. XB500-5]RKM56973.1 hypothetical protein D6856_14450 [Butyrivibrio sp. XB500-5]